MTGRDEEWSVAAMGKKWHTWRTRPERGIPFARYSASRARTSEVRMSRLIGSETRRGSWKLSMYVIRVVEVEKERNMGEYKRWKDYIGL